MSYLSHHHGSYWFQLRVPAPLVPHYSQLVRINLQTQDRVAAQHQAYQLAGYWLARFHAERHGSPYAVPPTPQPPAVATLDPPADSAPLTEPAVVGCSYDDLYAAWKRLDPDRDPTILREMKAIAKLVKEFTGVPPSGLQRADVARLRDHLARQRLARGTVAKKIGFVSTLLQAGYDAGLLSGNVARGMRVPKTQVETLVRRGFSVDELQRLVTSPIYTQRYRPEGGRGEAAAWLPLIALAAGARLEEIAQLHCDDLIADPVHGSLMRITDEGSGQRLKTESSRRMVPLHPQLIAAGLLCYAEVVREQGHQWLFPELDPDHDGRRGSNFGKWFQRYLRASNGLKIIDPEVVFHSLRHNFKTLCRAARIDEEIHDALTGHAATSVGRGYGEVPLDCLVPAIRSIVLPVTFPVIQE